MPQYCYACCKCKKEFYSIEKFGTDIITCDCGYTASRIFSSDGASFVRGPGYWADGRR